MKSLPVPAPPSSASNCSSIRCASCPAARSRRDFIAVAGAAAAGVLAAPSLLGAGPGERARVRVVFALHGEQQVGPDWPNKGFDFRPVMAGINDELVKACPELQILTSLATGEEQAKKIVDADKAAGIDGYVVYQMNCWNRVVQTLAATGKPVLYVDFQFGGSGGFLVYNAAFIRAGAANVGFAASSRIEDVAAAANCFAMIKRGGTPAEFRAAVAHERRKRTAAPHAVPSRADLLTPPPIADSVRWMSESRILAVREQEAGLPRESMGIKVSHVPFAELNDAWKAADRDEAAVVADRWQKTAAKVEGVSRETLEASAAMYLGMKALLKARDATAITVDCLGGFYGGHIHAYPCLGFHELHNEGRVGACECDVRSAATMVAGSILTQGRPGYISDPVIDTAKGHIIYAHCVASNRPFGPRGAANPFEILTHSEDRQGASVRSILPVGYVTTTIECDPGRKEILFHQARTVANDPDDRACRTKLCAEPIGDIEKLFTMWDEWGWHRVTFYGDLKEPVHALADALGWKVVEEA